MERPTKRPEKGVLEKWPVNLLERDRDFSVTFEGSQLRYGSNNYEISIIYYDNLSKKYSTSKKFSINLSKASPYERLVLSLNSLENVSYQTIALMLLTGTVVFLLVIILLFRRKRK